MASITTIQAIRRSDKEYPTQLRGIHNPPKELFTLGKIPDAPMLAIVGTRKPTNYGKAVAYRIAKDLALAGACIVSGLAYGIDGVVHRAALDAGGKTIAVLGSGLDRCYPTSHRGLMRDILRQGGSIISEYNPGTPPLKHHFPARNRIIAGMSIATLVPEADARSGSLITAQLALEENRLVMAIPGPITSERSAGPNNLIKAGATPVTTAADVLVALDMPIPTIKKLEAGTPFEQAILVALGEGALATEDLAAMFDVPISALLSSLSLLELSGKIRSLAGSQWMRA